MLAAAIGRTDLFVSGGAEHQGPDGCLAVTRSGVTLEGVAYKDKPEDARRFLDGLGNPFRRIGVDRNGTTAIDFGAQSLSTIAVKDLTYANCGPVDGSPVLLCHGCCAVQGIVGIVRHRER